MGWFSNFIDWITPPPAEETEVVRARTKKGRFIADDPSTPNVNEAYTTRKKKPGRPKKTK